MKDAGYSTQAIFTVAVFSEFEMAWYLFYTNTSLFFYQIRTLVKV